MSRQLKLRVSDEFAQRLEWVACHVGQPMPAVLELLVTPALEAAEADALFEAETLEAWKEYPLRGTCVTTATIDAMFADAVDQAKNRRLG